MPRECIYRPKQGFGLPLDVWLRGSLRDNVHDVLSPASVRDRAVFTVDYVEWLKRGFYDRGRELTMELYHVYLLELWLRIFLDGEGVPAGVTRDRPLTRGVGAAGA
jgi:asparagine synthase (glutamine-hydrolysing)